MKLYDVNFPSLGVDNAIYVAEGIEDLCSMLFEKGDSYTIQQLPPNHCSTYMLIEHIVYPYPSEHRYFVTEAEIKRGEIFRIRE